MQTTSRKYHDQVNLYQDRDKPYNGFYVLEILRPT